MRVALIIAFVVASVAAGAKRYSETVLLAAHLAPHPDLETRRQVLFGHWYANLQRLRAATPENATIDFVIVRPEGTDLAVLVAAELQPRDVRLFDGWEAWRQRKRATLFHDERAANAAAGPAPSRAQFVVVVDPHAAEPFQW